MYQTKEQILYIHKEMPRNLIIFCKLLIAITTRHSRMIWSSNFEAFSGKVAHKIARDLRIKFLIPIQDTRGDTRCKNKNNTRQSHEVSQKNLRRRIRKVSCFSHDITSIQILHELFIAQMQIRTSNDAKLVCQSFCICQFCKLEFWNSGLHKVD